MHTKEIIFMGQPAVLACDGKCELAWGISNRPRQRFGDDPDDFAFLSDAEIEAPAPADPGTYEGGHAKPASPADMNKWCARECERSDTAPSTEKLSLPDYSVRLFNQPWKHAATGQPQE